MIWLLMLVLGIPLAALIIFNAIVNAITSALVVAVAIIVILVIMFKSI